MGQARIINISGDGHAAEGATGQITGVLQTVLAAQLLKDGLDSAPNNGHRPPSAAAQVAPVPVAAAPVVPPAPRSQPKPPYGS